MTSTPDLRQRLELEIAMLRARLEDAEQMQQAIERGAVDGFVVNPSGANQRVMLLSPAPVPAPEGVDHDAQTEAALRAIRDGEVDGFVVGGEQVMLLGDAYRPYQTMVDRMLQGAVTVSSQGEVMYLNERFATMSGLPREQVLGRHLECCFVPADRMALRQVLEQSRVDRGQAELTLGRDSEGGLPVLVTGAGVGTDGAVILMFTDLTEQRRHVEIAAAARRKDEFLAVLAHELRNPLAPIRNAVQVLTRLATVDPQARSLVDVIERQSTMLTRLLDDLLDIKRLSHGKLTLRMQPVDLNDVVRNAVEAAQPLLDERRHALELDLPGRPLYVDGDPVRLMQILLNLLTNAAKYTDPGGRVRLRLHEAAGDDGTACAWLSVADDGIGIPASMLAQVFEPYAQLGGLRDPATAGLGLGLTVARQLLELHGGSISASSPGQGEGSEFAVCLPISTATHALPAARAAAPAAGVAVGLRILVADDNVDGASTLAMLLELSGHHPRTASDGLDALRVADEFRPEVAFLDLGMPGLDGYGVARKLRGKRWAAGGIAIFALTGWNQPEDQRRVQEAGFDAHLVKPFDAGSLDGLIAIALERLGHR